MRAAPTSLLVLLAWSCGVQAQEIVRGTGHALSGDLLELETAVGRRHSIRLQGLAAPPPGADCPAADGVGRWNCGDGSRDALQSRLNGEEVVCRLDGAGPAECSVQTLNLNVWMLQTGRAFLQPGWRGRVQLYDQAELVARRSGAMLWNRP